MLTNFLILGCVSTEKGPMYGNLKHKQFFLRAALWEESEVKLLLRNFLTKFSMIYKQIRFSELLTVISRFQLSGYLVWFSFPKQIPSINKLITASNVLKVCLECGKLANFFVPTTPSGKYSNRVSKQLISKVQKVNFTRKQISLYSLVWESWSKVN